MARDKFITDIHSAVILGSPRLDTDNPSLDVEFFQRMLRGADLWLTRKVVAAFQPADFDDLDKDKRDALIKAVGDFRRIAEAVDPRKPALPGQRDAALSPFAQIVRIVANVARDDWLSASAALLDEAEGWAKEQGWPSRRFPKDITEEFIGAYRLDKLVYSAEGAQLALIPLGRFAVGTDGRFDLAVMPAYDSATVAREGDRWFIFPIRMEEERQAWSKESFIDMSLQLARLP